MDLQRLLDCLRYKNTLLFKMEQARWIKEHVAGNGTELVSRLVGYYILFNEVAIEQLDSAMKHIRLDLAGKDSDLCCLLEGASEGALQKLHSDNERLLQFYTEEEQRVNHFISVGLLIRLFESYDSALEQYSQQQRNILFILMYFIADLCLKWLHFIYCRCHYLIQVMETQQEFIEIKVLQQQFRDYKKAYMQQLTMESQQLATLDFLDDTIKKHLLDECIPRENNAVSSLPIKSIMNHMQRFFAQRKTNRKTTFDCTTEGCGVLIANHDLSLYSTVR